ncbi:hypothetical protein PENSPDRAFT_662782 [Peniophora sp. CONT]|nr:hypothetical protein PENSPDRAFT_662782 [Peniophora sp. CONT]
MASPNFLQLLLTLQHWVVHFILRIVHWKFHFWLRASAVLLYIWLLPLRCVWRQGRKLNEQRADSGALPSSGQQFVYEIIQFTVTDAYFNDADLIKKVTKFIGAHAPGPIYTGLQQEEPTNQLTAFIGWNSKEQHEDFENDPAYYDLAPLVIPIAAGGSETFHASFEPTGGEVHAFKAPVTELVCLTPKSGVTLSELREVLRMTVESMNKDAREDPTLFGVAAGRVVEEEKFVYVAGWSSVEARKEWVRKNVISDQSSVRWMSLKPKKTLLDLADMSLVDLMLSSGR